MTSTYQHHIIVVLTLLRLFHSTPSAAPVTVVGSSPNSYSEAVGLYEAPEFLEVVSIWWLQFF